MKPVLKFLPLVILLSVVVIIFSRCHKEKFITDSSAMLEFSNDSVLFDTVFSTIGSATQYMHVYNRHDETIMISNIHLQSGSGSQYRFNIDGVDGPVAENIEILPHDSVWLFVEVTIDPGDVNVPFVVEDLLVFTTNGNEQTMTLNAWGRDAYFHGNLGYITLSGCNEVWTNDKPHVVYGIYEIPVGCTLTINEGCEVRVHGKGGIWANGGTLLAGSNTGNPVRFLGDRLEPEYNSLPGQWGIQVDIPIETGVGAEVASIIKGGLWIYNSPGSVIENCELRNGNRGIQVDSSAVGYDGGNTFSCIIRNTKVLNMADIGIFTQHADVKMENVLSGNCAQACAYLSYGGCYQVDNCTFANWWAGGPRTAPAFAINNYYVVDQVVHTKPFENTVINNCIMFGNSAFLTDFSEFVVDLYSETLDQQVYQFNNCLVDANVNVDNGAHFQSMNNNQAPFLCNPAGQNFHLSQDNSLMSGVSFFTTPSLDMDGNSWGTEVDKGCYKYVSEGCE